jgi:hypothetical protein
MGPNPPPRLESEYKPRLPAGRLPGATCSLLIKRSGVRIPLRAPAEALHGHQPRHQPKPYTGTSRTRLNTILDDEQPLFVYGRPRLSAPKDVKKDVKSRIRAA